MTSIFPENKEDFTAANGITYTWVENRWRTKTYDTNEYLPLTGGSITGDLGVGGTISNQGGYLLTGQKDKAFRVYDLQGGQVFDAHCDRFGVGVQYFGAIDQEYHVTTKAYVDSKVDSIELPDGGELSTKDKLYLQGFLPYKVKEDTNMRPGYIVPKDSNYQYTRDPAKWKYLMYSVEDAYGESTAGKFANHMHTEDVPSDYRSAQVWLVRENGLKICSYVGPIQVFDRNFEDRSDMTIENECTFVTSKNYDLQSLRIDADEIIWIKCSRWG